MKFFDFLKMSSSPKSKDKKKIVEPTEDSVEAPEPCEAVEATEANMEKVKEVAPVESKVEKPKVEESKVEVVPTEESNGEAAEKIQSEAEVIAEVLEKMGMSSDDLSVQEKLDALCLIFKKTIAENAKLKETMSNVNGQLEKNDMTKAALQKLCSALKAQVSLKDEENNLKLQEETQKRIDIAKNFESTMAELTKLIETHSSHNTALREENISMAEKLQELLKDFDGRDGKVKMIAEEFRLKSELYEAQIAKSKIEKAEMSADFNKERLEMQKSHLEAKKNIEILLTREDNLKEQIELYASQYEQMSKGVNEKKTNMGTFKTQVDNLNKKLKTLESDTTMWKEKFEESNDVVVKMNTAKASSDVELEATKRKLVAMEKLNRALQAERTQLLEKAKVPQAKNDQNGKCDDKCC